MIQQLSSRIQLKGNSNAPNSYNKSKALRYQRFDSVRIETVGGKKLAIETDKRFMHSIEQITKFQSSVLDQIMGLKDSLLNEVQCEEIHFKAKRHSQANILNVHSDMNKNDVIKQPSLKSLYCKCGCERLRGGNYPMCCELQKINILGSGILLFFFFLKTLVISIILFILIYGIYAITINLIGSKRLQVSNQCSSSYCLFRDNTTDQHNDNEYYNFIKSWIGLGATVIWIIWSRIVKYIGNLKNEQIDKNLTSASDFAIKISNLPYGDYNEQELVQYFQKLFQGEIIQHQQQLSKQINQQLSNVEINGKQKDDNERIQMVGKGLGNLLGRQLVGKIIGQQFIGVKSIQIIYNMQFSRKLIEKVFKLAKDIKSQIKEANDKYIVKNKTEYHAIKNQLTQTYELFEDLRKKFLNDSKFRKALSSRVCIVEFKQEKNKVHFLKRYGKQSLTLFKQLKEKIMDKCFGHSNSIVFKGSIPQIIRAPEPSDILWENCQKKQSLLRILLIYVITFFLILLSLGIMVGLQFAQSYFKSSNSSQNDSSSTLLNIVVSIVLQVINTALWISLSILLDLEYNHTLTNKIISQMTKSSVAMWINIIVLPIIVNYFINNRYYGADGLAGIVFDYHVSSIAVGLTIKLFDPINLIFKLIISIKCIRHYFIKARYRKKNREDLIEEQAMKNVYKFYQAPQFNIAEAYTYILSNVLHAAFFCSLQPFILVLVLFQGIIFYWVCKFKIVKFCKIPQITQKLIFDVATYQLILVPVFYGVGNIFNSYISNQLDSSKEFRLLAAAICAGLGLLNYFNPKNLVQLFINKVFIKCTCCFMDTKQKENNPSSSTLPDKESKKSVRLQTYYKSSNSLSLLGFENVLLGKTNTAQIETELQNYCQSHVNNGSKSQRVQEKVGSQIQPLDKDTELMEHLHWTNTQF